jgi:hypothetical protein
MAEQRSDQPIRPLRRFPYLMQGQVDLGVGGLEGDLADRIGTAGLRF